MVKIAGSFLKIQNDENKIMSLDNACDIIHFDIIDGKFTDGYPTDINLIDKVCNLKKQIDVHLMVLDVKKYTLMVKKINPSYITFHYEIGNTNELIDYIHTLGIKAGLAINPDTDIKNIYPYLEKIDLVLVMAVHPGKGGQKFINVEDKINNLIKYREENNLNFAIEVDGGINDNTVAKVKQADILVAGSFITDNEDYKSQVYKLKKCIRNGFTLAELLGVIVILSILSLIAVTAVDSSIKKSRYNSCMVQKKNLIEGTKNLLIDYPTLLPSTGSKEINVNILQNGGTIDGINVNGGYIEDKLVNPMTDKPYIESQKGVYVVVSTTNGHNYNYTVNFKNSSEDCTK